MDICICSNDKNLVYKLENFLEEFFYKKNINFKITYMTNLDNNKINLFDMLFIDLNENKEPKNTKKIPTIYISDIMFYTLNHINYNNILLKPINYNSFKKEFSSLFSKYLENHNKNKSFILEKIKNYYVKSPLTESVNNNIISKNLINNIKSSSIVYLESINKNKVKLFTDKTHFELDESIDFFEKNFSSTFFRCSKNHLVNLNKLSNIGKNFVIINNVKIDVDKHKFKELKSKVIDIFKIKF